MTIKGFTDSKKTTTVPPDYATLQPLSPWRYGLEVASATFYKEVGTDAAEAGSTVTTIAATAHAAKKGDVIVWTSGNLDTLEFRVSKTAADVITVGEEMPEAPTATDTFRIMRAGVPTIDSTGGLTVTFSTDKNYGTVGANTLRTAAQIGNAAGAADFNAGNVSAQTLRVIVAADQTAIPVSQSGTWDVAQDGAWIVSAVQSGSWSVEASQDGSWLVGATQSGVWAVDQSGAWTVAATQSGNWAVEATQAGTWHVTDITGTVSLPTGAATDASVTALRNGRTYVTSARHDYSSGNVTTGAWTQLVASTSDTVNELHIFDSSGRTLELGIGAAASESRRLLIPPGGFSGPVSLQIASGTRISVRAVSATASSGELTMTLMK